MIRWALYAGGLALAGVVLFAAGGLALAHRQIRALEPELPTLADAVGFAADGDLPVRVTWINSARQAMPRSAVIEPDLDPEPAAPYAMAFPAFALEWKDGRILLVDAGMERGRALEFGRMPERFAGAGPIEPLAPVAERLGGAGTRVAAIAFTHLHDDHTNGIHALCAARAGRLRVLQTPQQASGRNYTTRPGVADLEGASCAALETLDGGPLYSVEGFPGVRLVEAAGHTPCSQMLIARVRAGGGIQTWIFAGDVANHADAIRLDLPKPRLYSLLLVPEAPARLGEVRRWLRDLAAQGARVVLSHDERAIVASGIPAWGS